MEKIKLHTDLGQSKRLAEFLPLESADAHYGNFCPKGLGYESPYSIGLTPYIKEVEIYEEIKEEYGISNYNGIVAWEVIPAWSLAALLRVLPKIDAKEPMVQKLYYTSKPVERYICVYDLTNMTSEYDNPVDACVEMIIRLHELNML